MPGMQGSLLSGTMLSLTRLAADQMKSLFIQSEGRKGLNYLNLKMLSMNKSAYFTPFIPNPLKVKGMILSGPTACVSVYVFNLMKNLRSDPCT